MGKTAAPRRGRGRAPAARPRLDLDGEHVLRPGEPYRFARVFAQAVADEHAVDSGTFAGTMLFGPGPRAEDGAGSGAPIAAIARDAAFTGWEAEARGHPRRPGRR